MATKTPKAVLPKPGENPGKIVDIDVSSEMSESFLEYAYSVIYSSALPHGSARRDLLDCSRWIEASTATHPSYDV